MMITRKNWIPWSWVLFASFPFAIMIFAGAIPGMGFTFTLKKFVDNPALITFVLSIGLPITMVVGPTVNYLSDRLWTRFGRRKIFMVASALVTASAILCMPFAPNLPVLIACLILFNVGSALNTTTQPLSNEIIPIPQRGRASSLQYIILTIGNIVFYTFLIGRFDDVRFLGPLSRILNPMTGEILLYAVFALIVLTLMLMTALGIKEIVPPDRKTMDEVRVNGRFSLRKYLRFFFVDVFDRQWMALYMLLFANAMYSLGLGAMTPLLYTEQWGFSKQEMGMNVAIGAVILIPFAAVAGWFLDKFSKMKLYQACILIICVIKVLYWVFVQFILPDHRPALWQIILFGEMMAIVGTLSGVAMMPLYYEYVPRNKMGTAAAGMSLMSNLFGFLAANLTGLWVTGYSHIFCPPAGYETRVVLERAVDEAGLRQALHQGDPSLPEKGVFCEPLFPPGQGGTVGRHWMIRFADADAAAQEALRKQTEQTRLTLERARAEGRSGPADADELAALSNTLVRIETNRAAALAALQARVTSALTDGLVKSEQTVRAISLQQVALMEIPTERGLTKADVDELDARLRARLPGLIEVMPRRALDTGGRKQGVLCLIDAPAGTEPEPARVAELAEAIRSTVADSKGRLAFGLAPLREVAPANLQAVRMLTCWQVQVGLVEALSPRHETTLTKALRTPGQRAARVLAQPGTGALVRVVALAEPVAPESTSTSSALLDRRLQEAGVHDPAAARLLSDVLQQLTRAADGLRLTVERPVTAAQYAPQRYDYFSGYIFMFLTDILALYVTFVIIRLERKGVVRKLGVEEHQHHG